MLIKKTKLYLTVGIVLLTNAVTCLVAFFMTYSEKKSLSSAFWAMCITFGAAGAALLALAEHQSGHQLDRTRKRIQDRDHWFHSFEYPGCEDVDVSIDDLYIPPVETED